MVGQVLGPVTDLTHDQCDPNQRPMTNDSITIDTTVAICVIRNTYLGLLTNLRVDMMTSRG